MQTLVDFKYSNEIIAALKFIPAEDSHTWIKVGAAVYSELGDSGFSIWDDWSATASNYDNKAVKQAWKGFRAGTRTTIVSVFYEARQRGWCSSAPYTAPSPAYLAQLEAERREADAEAERRLIEQRNNAKKKAQQCWGAAVDLEPNHPYVLRKKIQPLGVKQDAGNILVPLMSKGEIVSIQYINPDGAKYFVAGGQVKGAYMMLGSLKNAIKILLAEGWATACSLHLATGLPVFVAFTAWNLPIIAEQLANHYPNAELCICGDADPSGTGQKYAQQAASQHSKATWCVPLFTKEESGTDFNDLHQASGLEVVSSQVFSALSKKPAVGFVGSVGLPQNENTNSGGVLNWPEPISIAVNLHPVPEFDYALLPQALRYFVKDVAERMQCPPDFPAVGVMVALASVLGSKVVIRPKKSDDWTVVPTLWGLIVGRPSAMKSPSLKAAMAHLKQLDAPAKRKFESEMAQFKASAADAEVEKIAIKENKKKATKLVNEGKKADAAALLKTATSAEIDTEEPVRRRYWVNDSTVEALGEVLMENPFGTLVYRDELHSLLVQMDKIGQEGARGFYLQAYDGDSPYTFDRIGRGKDLTIENLCLSMLGGMQPGKLSEYVHDATSGGTSDDGLLQRFGMAVWPNPTSEWENIDRFPDNEAKERAFKVFEMLDSLQPNHDEWDSFVPLEYRFTDAAQAHFDQWRAWFENDLRTTERSPALESHLGKYRKLLPTLALICHLCDGRLDEPVSIESLARALDWIDYLTEHAIRIYSSGNQQAAATAEALRQRIVNGDLGDHFTARQVAIKGWSNLQTPLKVRDICDLLVELRYLVEIEKPCTSKGGRPSVVYHVNPNVWEGKCHG